MDSPKSREPPADTVPAQDSPVFSFLSNLSPLQPVKPAPVTQGFPGLNSPPLVFSSTRLTPQNQSTFFRRRRLPLVLAAKQSEQNDGNKNSVTDVGAPENLDGELDRTAGDSDRKVSYSHSSVADDDESPTECPDKFLSDGLNMDSSDPLVSPGSFVKESDGGERQLAESIVRCEYRDNSKISEEMAIEPPDPAREVGAEYKKETSTNASTIETVTKLSVDPHMEIGSSLAVGIGLTNKDHNFMAESVEGGQTCHFEQFSNKLSGSVRIERLCENSGTNDGAVLTKADLKDIHNRPKYRVIRRRCLQFEDAPPPPPQTVTSNQPSQNPSEAGNSKFLPLETPLTSVSRKQDEKTQTTHSRNITSCKNIPKPSGIGLHLNSILNAVQPGSDAIVHVKSVQRGHVTIMGKKCVPSINSSQSDNSNISLAIYKAENVSACTDDNVPEIQANSSTPCSTLIVKSSNNLVNLNPVENQLTLGNKRKYNNTETDASSEEFKLSPMKKRKKSFDANEGGGCKRCNCKKSRCLKLYCDCFAAGVYCSGPCACQGCYNRPEYESTVLETRQQIESRNPLAFAPRVIQHAIEEDKIRFTPPSARHKRGCNCKKSMCLKKYCECYQANVGCSDGCRCEGCKNVFGEKGEYGKTKEISHEGLTDKPDVSFIQKMTASRQIHNINPPTSAIQLSNHRKDSSDSPHQAGTYFHSPESSLPFPGSPLNSDNSGMIAEIATSREIVAMESSDQQLCYGYGSSETIDEISAVHQRPSMLNPQDWTHSSPIRPVSKPQQAKPNQVVELDSESSNTAQDDTTPDILIDNPNPLNTVKVSSPNKKRVSPPHERQNMSGSNGLFGGRAGRKFILKAVPSFPPLSPCVQSKSNGPQQTSDPQNRTHKSIRSRNLPNEERA